MASKNDVTKFYVHLFGQQPNLVEYTMFKKVCDENVIEFCEMVCSNYRLFLYYDKWKDRFYEKTGKPKEINIYNCTPDEKIRLLFLKYQRDYLSEEELTTKRNLFENHMDLLDEVLLNKEEQYVELLLNLK